MPKAKKILCVVVYDVQCNRARTRIAHKLECYGTRINLSVFECMFTPAQLGKVQQYVQQQLHPRHDTAVFYRICMECYAKAVYTRPSGSSPGPVQTV